jgi:hypothetical protein
MHERFTRFMNGISASVEMRWSMAATSPELRGTSVFEHLMGVALVIVVMLALNEPASTIGLRCETADPATTTEIIERAKANCMAVNSLRKGIPVEGRCVWQTALPQANYRR